MKKQLLVVCFASVFGCVGLADASVIHVTPDGNGTGESWEDPAAIKAAFDAAVAANGGEIWIKEGYYKPSSGLTVCSNLVVRGGFAGNETSASAADPKAHPTILSGMDSGIFYGWSANAAWPDAEHNEPLWKDGRFNLARPDDKDIIFRIPTQGNVSLGITKMFSSSVPVTGLKIVGVTVTGTARGPAAVSLPAGSDFELSECRFLGCGCSGGGSVGALNNSVLETGGRVTMTNCEIIGCSGAVALSGTNTSLTNRFVGCLFDDCTGCGGAIYAGAIFATGKQPLEIKGCTFTNCVGTAGGNRSASRYQSGSAVAYPVTGGALRIFDTRFVGNRVRTLGTDTPNACVYSKSPMTVERCLFKDNTLKGASLDYAQSRAVCLFLHGTTLMARDTVFADNTVTGTTSLVTGQRWGAVAFVEKQTAQFVNCSFYGNDVMLQATTDDGKASHACGVVNVLRNSNSTDSSIGVTFVNCLFSDNRQAANVERQADVYLDSGTVVQFTLSFVNTAIWSAEANHKPYYASASFPVSISHSDLVNCTATPMTNKNDYVEYVTTVDPVVFGRIPRPQGTYLFRGMRGLDPSSPFVRAGTPVYEKGGSFYFHAPGQVSGKPWRTCHLKSTSLASLDGAALVADGFGAAREAEKFSYGPVVNRVPGLMIMVR